MFKNADYIKMSVKKNNNSISAQALEEMKQLSAAIRAESKNTIDYLVKEAVKDYIREADEDEDDSNVEQDYEVVDEPTQDTDTENTSETDENEFNSEEDSSEETPTEDDTEEAFDDEESNDGDDEWSDYSKYQVDDDTYDLTGEEDYNEIVKVYKLLKDDDSVSVKKDGNMVSIEDNETGAEYVIDLSGKECSTNDDCEMEFEMEGCIKEAFDDNIAGQPDDFNSELTPEDFNDSDMMDELTPEDFNNFNESRKTMKEKIYEIDLGYTDNYQDKDPIDGLSMTEPSKSGESWEEGVPTGTEKPWAGETKSKGEPFEKTVNENDNPMENPTDDVEANKNEEENGMFEGTNVTLPNVRKKSKSHSPQQKDYPKVQHHDSKNADYKAMNESIIKKAKAIQKENKELRNAVNELKKALREAAMTNVNLGQVTKLFVENTTTKEEKVNIINKFNSEAKTIEQSKALYESFKKELNKNNTTIVTENNSPKQVEGTKKLNESVVYKSKDLMNTIDLINRMNNL